MGVFLGRDALTGIAIERGQRIITIPIEYVGVDEHTRKTGLDQGWRIAGLPVEGSYDEYGASTAAEAPEIPREDSDYADRGHMFMVRSSLYHHLIEEGVKTLLYWDSRFAKNLEAFRDKTPAAIAQNLLKDSSAVSVDDAFPITNISYFYNWVDYSLLNRSLGELTDPAEVESLVSLYLFLVGALTHGFSFLSPSYPDGSQVSTKEDIILREIAKRLGDEVEGLDWDDLETVQAFEDSINKHIARLQWVAQRAKQVREKTEPLF